MTQASGERLRGLRVLLVEDSDLIAMHIELMLQQAGCRVVAVADSASAALDVVREKALDAAVLDVNVKDGKIFGVADELESRGVPFVLSTGSGERQTPERFAAAPQLRKPFGAEALLGALGRALR